VVLLVGSFFDQFELLVGSFDQVGPVKFTGACNGGKLSVVRLKFQVVRVEWRTLHRSVE
jgi:hypothetical protein